MESMRPETQRFVSVALVLAEVGLTSVICMCPLSLCCLVH